MFDLAVREERWATADTLIRRRYGDQLPYDVRVLFAVVRKDTTAERQLRQRVERTAGEKGRRGDRALETALLLAAYLEDLDRAEEFARFSTKPALPARGRASAHLFLSELAVTRGRWTIAKSEFETVARLGLSDSALVGRALAATLPFLSIPSADIEVIRSEVEAWKPGTDVSTPLPESVRPLAGHFRLYLLGLLSTRLGKVGDADRLASELEMLSAPSNLRPVVRTLARTIRADLAMQGGRTNEGLALLKDLRGEVPLPLIWLSYFSEEHPRYLRARLLYQAGHYNEALRLAEFGFVGTRNELHYRAPAHLLQAEIQQRLGNRTAAAEHYSRFIRLWRSCDPPLRLILEGAKAELARLVAEPR
jgi:tetratricopeptide (TPR) repeat protein